MKKIKQIKILKIKKQTKPKKKKLRQKGNYQYNLCCYKMNFNNNNNFRIATQMAIKKLRVKKKLLKVLNKNKI